MLYKYMCYFGICIAKSLGNLKQIAIKFDGILQNNGPHLQQQEQYQTPHSLR